MPAGESAHAVAVRLETEADRLRAEANHWHAGAAGEERVAGMLAPAEGASMRVLHDRLLKPDESKANLDHLVVCTGGVFLVDAKNWSGSVTSYGESLWVHWTDATGRQSRNEYSELKKISGMARAVSSRSGHPVRPVLCLTGDDSSRFGVAQPMPGVTVVAKEHLVDWLRAQPPQLTPAEVATLAVDLSCLFPPAVHPGHTLSSLRCSADGCVKSKARLPVKSCGSETTTSTTPPIPAPTPPRSHTATRRGTRRSYRSRVPAHRWSAATQRLRLDRG